MSATASVPTDAPARRRYSSNGRLTQAARARLEKEVLELIS